MPPYAATVDAARFADGQHVVRARARDTAGRLSAWASATVRLAGGAAVGDAYSRQDAWVGGLVQPSAFAQAPDGRLFVAEQGGTLRVVKAGVLLATPFHRFTAIDSTGERGLVGVAIDPDFARNGFVYVYYTATTPTLHNRISRLVAAGDVSSGSEAVLVDLPPLSGATNHNGGGMHFGPDGKLYVGVGENANAARAQDVSDPLGKLLRFNPDGSIPPDNPFCTLAALRCAVWALGLRNPFTFAFQPGTGRLHVNDVGQNAWEEIDVGAAGANYGWPAAEGPGTPPAGATAPLFAYPHTAPVPRGSGPGGFLTGFVIAGAAFYPDAGPFPAARRGNYFFADFAGRWVAHMDLANDGAVSTFANLADNPVDLLVGQDGALYVLGYGGGTITRIAAR